VSLLVVVGFSAEAALLTPGTAVLNAAANPEKLAAALGALRPSAVLSFGIAGGLDPTLRPGALLVARAVVAEARWPAHAAWSAALAAATGAAMADIALSLIHISEPTRLM
jgi:adenosylhomocysteine nucleosidase